MAEMTFEEIMAAVQQFSPDEKRRFLEELKNPSELKSSDSEAQNVKTTPDENN